MRKSGNEKRICLHNFYIGKEDENIGEVYYLLRKLAEWVGALSLRKNEEEFYDQKLFR